MTRVFYMYGFFSYSLFYTETQQKPLETQWFNIRIFLETNIETVNFMKNSTMHVSLSTSFKHRRVIVTNYQL